MDVIVASALPLYIPENLDNVEQQPPLVEYHSSSSKAHTTRANLFKALIRSLTISNNLENETSSIMAEFEENGPSQPPSVQTQGGATSLLPPPTPHSSTSGAAAAANPPMVVAGPILLHIATISSHAEDTITSITHDMDMSTVAYLVRRATGNSLQSQLDLYHLNNLLQHVVKFATDENVSGYLDGVTPDRLERACNSSSHIYHSIEAVGTKVWLFARCQKRRVKNIKGDVIRVIRELEESVEQLVEMMETHLGAQLPGWALLLKLFRFAREAWEQVAA